MCEKAKSWARPKKAKKKVRRVIVNFMIKIKYAHKKIENINWGGEWGGQSCIMPASSTN